ncbi:L-asparaginase [Actinoplanes tereljensis]|uniref:L-asparaginase n=1 Tax=Paractinoplanes tereljensis TaxID=571912 RepID=A0A919NKL9_9ACTN|nr:asparaginase [Actinoplanes tereljensis]GIF19706.1 L-asparaginase [Actinoplanes tereljensis]
MSRVLVVGLGGTIAMTGSAGVVPSLTAQQLVDAVPGLPGDLEVHSFRNKPGASLTLTDLTDLADLIRQSSATGTVITQGTDTIEETAYVLDLLHTGPEPIVVTGAMRNPTLAGADGPANLLAAVTVAADPAARDLGCLVVLADEIHAAARVRKTHSMHVATFASANGGPLGYVVEGRPRLVNRPVQRYTLPSAPTRESVRVGLCTATLGDDGTLLRTVAEQVDGLVIAAFGVGHVPESWVPHLAEAAARIPVVLASRTGAGYVGTDTYGFPGSERDLLDRGLIPAGSLDPYKARLLLHLLLTTTANPAQIRAEIAAAGA